MSNFYFPAKLTGKILETNRNGSLEKIPPFEEIEVKILGEDGHIYLIPHIFDYMKIDKSLRSPLHKGISDYESIGRKVLFNYFEWNGFRIVSEILIDLKSL